jgi:hypothetical protein
MFPSSFLCYLFFSNYSDIQAKMKNKMIPLLGVSLILNLVLAAKIYVLLYPEKLLPLAAPNVTKSETKNNQFDEINPEKGFRIKAKFGNIGPQMIKNGVIDLEKFKQTYSKSGQPLTAEQEKILVSGSDNEITIDRDNSYFLLNFFWAVGLNNKSVILEKGEITKYGGRQDLGNFASTGGWSLGKTKAMDYYSKNKLIKLTPEQEALVSSVASNIFRPCCNNSTAFPDCNHGMALLGVLELMAGSGASEDEMYQAAKYFNAYWFPGNYYDLALYFKNKEGKSFSELDAKLLLSKEYSSASGWKAAKKWLIDNGLEEQPPAKSGGCGV